MTDPTVHVDGLTKTFSLPGGERLRAVNDVSFDVARGEVLGVVGESGSGKSTLARCLVRLLMPDAGSVRISGTDVLGLGRRELRRFRRHVQMVFQNPYASLNPRMTVEQNIAEGLLAHDIGSSAHERRRRVVSTLQLVGLDDAALGRYPRSFSGGQRQRIAIARALAVEPEVLICDEPISSLDVSVQAQVVNLLQDMQRRLGLTIIFIAHDLAVVRHLCDRIVVMYQGAAVEVGTRQQVYGRPQHDYTRALLAAVPIPDPPLARARRHKARMVT